MHYQKRHTTKYDHDEEDEQELMPNTNTKH